MSEQIIAMLKSKLAQIASREGLDLETRRNVLKEDLQYYLLNFIYHHPEYSRWVMYGGSALRIIHELDRMSIDLDFEISSQVSQKLLDRLKGEIETHFSETYGAEPRFLDVKSVAGRGLLLKFNIGDQLGLGHPSKQVHVKIDLNHFVASGAVTERRPINRDQLSFVILTYNMSALMASKLAAIFLRGKRGVGKSIFDEKGRDIYDLLWYMNRKIVPDLSYLKDKKVDAARDVRALFDQLTIKMNRVSDTNLKQDLLPLFTNQIYIQNWLKNWRDSYLQCLEEYHIRTVTALRKVLVYQSIYPQDKVSFIYCYDTEAGEEIRIGYEISEYWFSSKESELSIPVDTDVSNKIEFSVIGGWTTNPVSRDDLDQYAALFYVKTENYLKSTNRILLGKAIITKLIRMTAENFNPSEQIVLNKSALLSCELRDMLK